MSFQDKPLQCSDCGQQFTFTAGEQEFYSVVPSAAEQERHRVTEALATAMRHDGKRFRLLDTR